MPRFHEPGGEERFGEHAVVLTAVTPGGGYKVASPASPGYRYGQAGPGWYGFRRQLLCPATVSPRRVRASVWRFLLRISGLLQATTSVLPAPRILNSSCIGVDAQRQRQRAPALPCLSQGTREQRANLA